MKVPYFFTVQNHSWQEMTCVAKDQEALVNLLRQAVAHHLECYLYPADVALPEHPRPTTNLYCQDFRVVGNRIFDLRFQNVIRPDEPIMILRSLSATDREILLYMLALCDDTETSRNLAQLHHDFRQYAKEAHLNQ